MLANELKISNFFNIKIQIYLIRLVKKYNVHLIILFENKI
jgi:hypothetical protein